MKRGHKHVRVPIGFWYRQFRFVHHVATKGTESIAFPSTLNSSAVQAICQWLVIGAPTSTADLCLPSLWMDLFDYAGFLFCD